MDLFPGQYILISLILFDGWVPFDGMDILYSLKQCTIDRHLAIINSAVVNIVMYIFSVHRCICIRQILIIRISRSKTLASWYIQPNCPPKLRLFHLNACKYMRILVFSAPCQLWTLAVLFLPMSWLKNDNLILKFIFFSLQIYSYVYLLLVYLFFWFIYSYPW